MEARKQICVLGLGNLMRTDDAVGMMAVRTLAADNDLSRAVECVEGGTLGLDLMHALTGITHLLALDAVDVGAEPGTLVRFGKHRLGEIPAAKSAHLLGFADLMGVLRLLGDEPAEITLLGLQPESTGWGTELTTKIKQALPELLQASRRQIEAWLAEGEPALDVPLNIGDQAHA